MTNTSDEEEVKKAIDKDEVDRLNILSALNNMIKDRGGRMWIWNMLSSCHVFNSSMTGDNKTFFHEGERNVGLSILRDVMEADPSAFAKMTEEFKNG